jgi:hypothetical protein
MAANVPRGAPAPIQPTTGPTANISGESNPSSFPYQACQSSVLQVQNVTAGPAIAASSNAGAGPATLLDEGVPPKVKASIVSGEYIELTKLDKDLYNEVEYNIKVGECDDDVSLQLAKKKEPKSKITTFDQWLDLFYKFMFIYMSHVPHEAAQLLTHSYTVRSIYKKGGDWLGYDREFRKRKARLNLSWDSVCQLSYANALTKHSFPSSKPTLSTSRFNQPFRAGTKMSVPQGYCFRYHKSKEGCRDNNCKWKHQCYLCKGHHKQSACTNSQSASRQNSSGKHSY